MINKFDVTKDSNKIPNTSGIGLKDNFPAEKLEPVAVTGVVSPNNIITSSITGMGGKLSVKENNLGNFNNL